jgi:hypothetical protein
MQQYGAETILYIPLRARDELTEGTLELDRRGGTVFKITFPI